MGMFCIGILRCSTSATGRPFNYEASCPGHTPATHAKPVASPVDTLACPLRRQLWEHAVSKDAIELLPALKRLAVERTVSSCWDA